MIINMWSTGELKRETKVLDQKVYMKITRPLDCYAEPICIELNNAHIYYPSTQQEFFYYLPVYSILAAKLRLPDEMSTVKRLIDYIQDGFGELFSTFPDERADRDKKVVGEVSVSHGDMKICHEILK